MLCTMYIHRFAVFNDFMLKTNFSGCICRGNEPRAARSGCPLHRCYGSRYDCLQYVMKYFSQDTPPRRFSN